MRVAIIGAGLAGTACAYVLKHAGLEPVIYEAQNDIALGASGNDRGLYNPRIAAEYMPEAEYFDKAFHLALETFGQFEDVGLNPCGALHLVNDEKKERRFQKCAKNWSWDDADMRMVSADDASEIAGINVGYEALYMRQSGAVSPKKLCAAYSEGVEIHLNAEIVSLDKIKADALILAGGPLTKTLFDLPTQTVRGQVTQVGATEVSSKLKCNICYGGYFSAAQNGVHMLGSSFQRWLDHTDILPQDDQDNIDKLAKHIPELAIGLEVQDHRASLRTTAPDHFPIVGQVDDHTFVSTAHGSHGILSSLMAAHHILSMVSNTASPLSDEAQKRLSPSRFLGAE